MLSHEIFFPFFRHHVKNLRMSFTHIICYILVPWTYFLGLIDELLVSIFMFFSDLAIFKFNLLLILQISYQMYSLICSITFVHNMLISLKIRNCLICQIPKALGCKNNPLAYDITAACSGFVLGLVSAGCYIRGKILFLHYKEIPKLY